MSVFRRMLPILLMGLLIGCGGVDTGHRGIWVRFGKVTGEPIGEGLYFYNPITWDLVEYPVREEKWSDQTAIFTRDTQQVTVEFSVIFRAIPTKVGVLFEGVGYPRDLATNIIRPIVLGSIKDAIGQVIADNLVGEREKVTRAALEEVRSNLRDRHVEITDLQLTNLDFDNAYEQAVEQKVVAIQEALKAKNETVKIKEEAEQKIMTAKADAESMRIKTQALAQSKGLVEYEMVKKWDGAMPLIINGGGGAILNIPDTILKRSK